MKVLVACERSGVVRNAFIALGHDAWSCDIYPAQDNGPHLQKDVEQLLTQDWDLMIAHPPCTYLCVAGAKHFKHKDRQLKQLEALQFFRMLLEAPISKIAIENPIGVVSTKIGKPQQIIQPYMFGDPQRKSTCLWLKNLPLLVPTQVVQPKLRTTVNGKSLPQWMYSSQDQATRGTLKMQTIRSRTFQGIANAMAQQWGALADA